VTVLAAHAADDVCDLVTTGRRSGRPHEVEIWFGVVTGSSGDELALISGNGPTADWYRNLLADPHVRVRLGDAWYDGTARDVTDPEERRRVGDVMGAKYVWGGDPSIGLTYDAWCYEVPAALVRLVDPTDDVRSDDHAT
jgi:deazaflavin-dependent oxidoreductase (nitroreductase family)